MLTLRKTLFSSTYFLLGALLFGICLTGCSSRQKHVATPSAAVSASPAPAADTAALVKRGKLIFNQTPKYASAYVGNQLSCNDCHLKSGTADYAAPMIDLAGLFPMFNKRAGHVISLQNRIQECFSRSESGTPPPIDSPEMRALVAYIDSLSLGVKGKPYKARGLVKIPVLQGNAAAGRRVYITKCIACHGDEGDGEPPILPAVWGRDSYNDGAGMNDPAKMAAFVFHNMPQSHPGTLTLQQAYDVAAFIQTKPRPKFNPAYKNY